MTPHPLPSPGCTLRTAGVTYLVIAPEQAVEIYGPFTACDCRPFCGLPPCAGCGEDHGGHDHGDGVRLCRDCDLEQNLAAMLCPGCQRMRYRTDVFGGFGEYLWGERCGCGERAEP